MRPILPASLLTSLKRDSDTKNRSLGTKCRTDSGWDEGEAATPSRAHSTDRLWLGGAQKLTPRRKGRKKGVFSVIDLRSWKAKRSEFREGAKDLVRCAGGGEGSFLQSGQLTTRPRKTTHFCGLRLRPKGTRGGEASLSPGFQMAPPCLGSGAPHCHGFPPLSLSGKVPSAEPRGLPPSSPSLTARRGARGQPHAPICAGPPSPGRAPAGWSTGTRGLQRFFSKQKALAARRPLLPGPRHLPFTPTPHLPGTRAARCLSRQTMGSELARQPAWPHPGTPRGLGAAGSKGDGQKRGERGHNGEGGRLPLGIGGSLPARGKGEGAGVQLRRPARGSRAPRPAAAAHSPAR